MKELRPFDLEDRTYQFTIKCRNFTKIIPKTLSYWEYAKQLIRSSGSTAANYIEANEALSKKDFVHRLKICRKEVKESRLWLKLIETGNVCGIESEQNNLIDESTQLIKIFTSIIEKNKITKI
ncbi:MAG: four helix bundle protein [Candidatus Parcubacteria bacterium]|nr:four helix bundle protein [Candidatus Parcubacteria bacterium]